MTIPEYMESIGKLRSEIATEYEKLQEKRSKLEDLKNELQVELEAIGLKSAKAEDFTAAIVSKPKIIVTHKESVIDWLRTNPDVEPDQYITLDLLAFKPLAKAWLKKTGEVIPGTDTTITEYLSLINTKKEK